MYDNSVILLINRPILENILKTNHYDVLPFEVLSRSNFVLLANIALKSE